MMEQLEAICYRFRNVIETIRKDGKFHNSTLSFDFPAGTCGDTSELLGRFLLEEFGFDCFYVCGEYYESRGDHHVLKTHAWLEYQGHKIDITADQFEDVVDKVLVVKEHALYKQYEESNRRAMSEYFPVELEPTYTLIRQECSLDQMANL